MYIVLRVHLSSFQQDLQIGFKYVEVIQKFVIKVKKNKQFLSNKTSLECLRNINKNIFEIYSTKLTAYTMPVFQNL